MKHYLVPVAAALASLTGTAQTQTQMPAQRLSELRLTIQQTHAHPPAAAGPRQLTADERAELRRQVLEQSRKATKS